MSTQAQAAPGTSQVVSIDLSGAPTRNRNWTQIPANIFVGLLIATLLNIPIVILELTFHLDRFEDGRWSPLLRACTFATLLAGQFLMYWGTVGAARDAEKRIILRPYGISLGRANAAVRHVLHLRFLRHPNFWALTNFVVATVVFVVAASIEAGVGRRRTTLALDPVLAAQENPIVLAVINNFFAIYLTVFLLLLFNAGRLYMRLPSLARFAIATIMFPVAILLGLLLYYVSAEICGLVYAFWRDPQFVRALWSSGEIWSLDPHIPTADLPNPSFVLFAVPTFAFVMLDATVPPFKRAVTGALRSFLRVAEAVQLGSAKQALKRDKRPPVLYLRSFAADQGLVPTGNLGPEKRAKYQRLEQAITYPLREAGPFVAIGKPGELAVAGAARAYYANDKWQAAVTELMDRARYIVVVLGRTQGLQWELDAIRARSHIAKTIWVLPSDPANRQSASMLLRQYLLDSDFATDIGAQPLEHALLLHPLTDGKVAVVRSKEKTSGDYEAAVQTALYGMACA